MAKRRQALLRGPVEPLQVRSGDFGLAATAEQAGPRL